MRGRWRVSGLVCVALLALLALLSGAHAQDAGDQPTDDLGAPAALDSQATLQGQVVLGPTCPVIRADGGGACADRPFQADLVVQSSDGSSVVAQLTSDAQGLFSVQLAPGTYLLVPLSPEGRPFPRAAVQTVTLQPGASTSVVVQYDTGIR